MASRAQLPDAGLRLSAPVALVIQMLAGLAAVGTGSITAGRVWCYR